MGWGDKLLSRLGGGNEWEENRKRRNEAGEENPARGNNADRDGRGLLFRPGASIVLPGSLIRCQGDQTKRMEVHNS